MSHRPNAHALLLLGASTTLVLAGCSLSWPWRQSPPDSSVSAGAGTSPEAAAAQCASLREQIKNNQETVRQAPTTSINGDIVAAAQGKADKKMDEARAQYDALGCSAADLPASRDKIAPLPPAPGGLQH